MRRRQDDIWRIRKEEGNDYAQKMLEIERERTVGVRWFAKATTADERIDFLEAERERLFRELEAEKIRALEAERRLEDAEARLDSEFAKAKLHLRKEIADRTMRATRLEMQAMDAFEDMDEMDAKMRILESENEALRLRLNRAEGALQGERKEMEYRARDVASRLAQLMSEVERLRILLVERQRENDKLRENLNVQETLDKVQLQDELKRIRDLLEAKMDELERWKRHSEDLEKHLGEQSNMANEAERLKSFLEAKMMECEEWKAQARNFQAQAEGKQRFETDMRRLKDLLEVKMREIDDWKDRYTGLETMVREQAIAEGKLVEFEDKLSLMVQEVERHRTISRTKDEELNMLRKKCRDLEIESRDRVSLEEEIGRLKMLLEGKMSELDEWQSKYSRLELAATEKKGESARIKELEQKCLRLNKELAKGQEILKGRNREVEEHKAKINRIEGELREQEGLIGEVANLKDLLEAKLIELQECKANCRKLEILYNESSNITKQISEREKKIGFLNSELEKAQFINSELSSELDKTISNSRALELEMKDRQIMEEHIVRLKEIVEGKMAEQEHLRAHISKVEWERDEAISGESRFKEFEWKIENQMKEIERLRAETSGRRKEAEDAKLKVARLETKIRDEKNLEDEVNRVKLMLGEKMAETDEWKGKYREIEQALVEARRLEPLIGEQERKKMILTNEIERLNSELREHRELIDKVQQRSTALEIELRDRENLESDLMQLKLILQKKLAENDELRMRLSQMEIMVSDAAGGGGPIDNNSQKKIKMLLQEIDRLSKVLLQKTHENEELVMIVKQSGGGQKELEMLRKEVRILKEHLHEKSEECEGLRDSNYGLMREMEERMGNLGKDYEEWKTRALTAEPRARQRDILEDELRRVKEALEFKIRENERLARLAAERQDNIDNLIVRVAKLEEGDKQMIVLQARLEERAEHTDTLLAELDHLNNVIEERNQEIKRLREEAREAIGLRAQLKQLEVSRRIELQEMAKSSYLNERNRSAEIEVEIQRALESERALHANETAKQIAKNEQLLTDLTRLQDEHKHCGVLKENLVSLQAAHDERGEFGGRLLNAEKRMQAFAEEAQMLNKHLEELREKYKNLQNELRRKDEENYELQNEIEKIKEISAMTGDFQNEKNEFVTTLNKFIAENNLLKEKLKEKEELSYQIQNELNHLNAKDKMFSEEKGSLEIELAQKKVQVTKLENDLNNLEILMNEKTKSINEKNDRIQLLEKESIKMHKTLSELEVKFHKEKAELENQLRQKLNESMKRDPRKSVSDFKDEEIKKLLKEIKYNENIINEFKLRIQQLERDNINLKEQLTNQREYYMQDLKTL